MNPIILVAESGSDMTPEIAKEYGVVIVPMHVSFGGETRDDGSFPVSEMFDFYKTHKELPRTSGCTPNDFEAAFSSIREKHPDAPILYLAYSACTTCSMQSAMIASEKYTGIVAIDTKSVTAGQTAIVLRVAKHLRSHPETTMDEAVAIANEAIAKVRMGFVPGDLDYLRAGGRVSNAAYLGAKILSLHPLIEILDGKLISTKKYRGNMASVVAKVTSEYPDTQKLAKDQLYLIYNDALTQDIRSNVERILREKGYQQMLWVHTGCVISAHCGPGSFGIVGFAE